MNDKFKTAWSKDTCYPPLKEKWSEDCPELGQCAVTALVIQDNFGGELAFNKELNHYWNVLPNGKEIDLTRAQFPDVKEVTITKIAKREDFGEDVIRRYKLLKKRIRENR